jgi:hypothetical protein
VKFDIEDFAKISVETPNLAKNRTEILGTLHEDLDVFRIIASDVCSAVIQRTYCCAAVATLLILIVDSDMCVSNTKGTHCCVSMATVVMRTRRCYVIRTLPALFRFMRGHITIHYNTLHYVTLHVHASTDPDGIWNSSCAVKRTVKHACSTLYPEDNLLLFRQFTVPALQENGNRTCRKL